MTKPPPVPSPVLTSRAQPPDPQPGLVRKPAEVPEPEGKRMIRHKPATALPKPPERVVRKRAAPVEPPTPKRMERKPAAAPPPAKTERVVRVRALPPPGPTHDRYGNPIPPAAAATAKKKE